MPRRRKPLPRGTPPKRTPGPAGGTLRTGTPRKALPPQSAKRKAQQKVRRDLAAALRGARCRLAIAGTCTGAAEHWHELVGSGVGGSRVDPRNMTPACDACNSKVETLACRYEIGAKVHAWDAVAGDGGLVPREPHPLALATTGGDTPWT